MLYDNHPNVDLSVSDNVAMKSMLHLLILEKLT